MGKNHPPVKTTKVQPSAQHLSMLWRTGSTTGKRRLSLSPPKHSRVSEKIMAFLML